MNLSDDLTPAATDPALLLRVVRFRRRVRFAARAAFPVAAVLAVAIGLWSHAALRQPPQVAPAAHAQLQASVPAAAVAQPSVTMTRDELIDSLKDQTYALIQWPDGREQLLIRR